MYWGYLASKSNQVPSGMAGARARAPLAPISANERPAPRMNDFEATLHAVKQQHDKEQARRQAMWDAERRQLEQQVQALKEQLAKHEQVRALQCA